MQPNAAASSLSCTQSSLTLRQSFSGLHRTPKARKHKHRNRSRDRDGGSDRHKHKRRNRSSSRRRDDRHRRHKRRRSRTSSPAYSSEKHRSRSVPTVVSSSAGCQLTLSRRCGPWCKPELPYSSSTAAVQGPSPALSFSQLWRLCWLCRYICP